MDLLAGYDSGDSPSHSAEGNKPGAATGGLEAQGVARKEPEPVAEQPVLNRLPAQRKRKPVLFRVPAPEELESSSDEEEEKRRKKQQRTAGPKATLAECLPPPKSSSGVDLAAAKAGRRGLDVGRRGPGADEDEDRLPAFGGGVAAASVRGLSREDAETYRRLAAPAEDPAAVAELDAPDPHEYRANLPLPAGAPASAAAALDGLAAGGPEQWNGVQQDALTPGEAAAQEARLLASLQAQGGGEPTASADPFAGLGLQFKEVSQRDLTAGDPSTQAAASGLRTAFGPGYEATLRAQAGANPDRISRRKHQISSLLHHAKMKELEMMDARGQALKTKAQTQAKYGW